MRLLLFSNSTNAGEEYLGYAMPYINEFLAKISGPGIFIPFAGISLGMDKYYTMVKLKFDAINIKIQSIHNVSNMVQSINEANFIVVGGGNTFCLLKELQTLGLMDPIRERVQDGIPYIGWSAGSNVTSPTIKTTNDMPIVEPDNFKALQLIPFQINPHYIDFKMEDHAGETREMRIEEFILANKDLYVAGLREGTLLACGDKICRSFGQPGGQTRQQPHDYLVGEAKMRGGRPW